MAGIRSDLTGWIRPVSTDADGTLWPQHYLLTNDEEASVLDFIEVEVLQPAPKPHHPENWILSSRPWQLIERLDSLKALSLLQKHLALGSDLLGNQSDRINIDTFNLRPASASLALIEPYDVSWEIGLYYGTRRARAIFRLRGQRYNLSITDPKWRQRLAHLELGLHSREAAGINTRERVFFTISLGEPFNGECYKLVAAVIVLPG